MEPIQAARHRNPTITGQVPTSPSTPRTTPRWVGGLLPNAPEVRRDPDDRVVSGVAAGIGRWLGVDPGMVRLCVVVLATAGGLGIVLYLVAQAVIDEPSDADAPAAGVGPPPTVRRAAGFACIVAGTLLLLRAGGIWIADSLTLSVGLAAIGSAVVWVRASDGERRRWRGAIDRAIGDRTLPDLGSLSRIRLWVGALLLLAGVLTFLATIDLASAIDVLLAGAIVAVGVALVVGPWLQALGRQVAEERRERIRADERADMAAHLHDSVLQTLALIQRAESPEEMSRLARGQERELRGWLFGRRPQDEATRLGEAVQDAAGRVEDHYGVTIEVVLAGDLVLVDHPQADDLTAMVAAASEAMANAGKHAQVSRIDVFVEVSPDEAAIFVRDQGRGFGAEDIEADRRGIEESVRGRMRRHGGTAMITSVPGEGTEVELSIRLDPDHGAEDRPRPITTTAGATTAGAADERQPDHEPQE